jgi:hypothetical protein
VPLEGAQSGHHEILSGFYRSHAGT